MIIKSKLIPPQSQKAVLHRERLQERLITAITYPLTLVHAGTGFGKTTTLVELGSLYKHVYWYNITEPDRDPTLFLAHLVSAFLPATAPLLERLEKGGGVANTGIFNSLINQLTTDLEEDAILILDDFHLVNNVTDINHWFEALVEQQPPHLHIAIASRQIPETPAFIRWQVKGNILLIDQSDLSFSQDEIISLFADHFHFAITNDQAQALYSYTDGWIIALQMIWQRLQSSHSKNLDNILAELPTALSNVFNFLAQEVLLRQPKPIQQFLVSTAILREMDAECCDYLMEIDDSQEILRTLNDKGLFISIHAPTRGATGLCGIRCRRQRFQSTLPHGERRRDPRSWSIYRSYFNPRSHTGSDFSPPIKLNIIPISIHGPTRGATGNFADEIVDFMISIHAPTRGATCLLLDKPECE